jgi:CRISPR-associated protein (TIGR02710 family)
MKVGLVVTVGTTSDPILKAIREVRSEYHQASLTVVFLYGRPFPGQPSPTPFDVAYEAQQKAKELQVDAQPMEVPDPEDIDEALRVSRQALQRVAGSDLVIVNFTGGTKVLSAAVVHAALTERLIGKLILDYTGGALRDAQGRVQREAMRVKRDEQTWTHEVIDQVLELLRRFAYREARFLAESLPQQGQAGFVRQVAKALCDWDEFWYDAAVRTLRALYGQAEALMEDARLGPIARQVRRMLEPGQKLMRLTEKLRDISQSPQGRQVRLDQSELDYFSLLIADTLENGDRRIREGRPTDSVLRSYRAVELAVQGRLLQEGVNPWQPDWRELKENILTGYLSRLQVQTPPPQLALRNGLTLLEVMGVCTLNSYLQRHLQDLQQGRNLSYLEHGFGRLDDGRARQLWEYALELTQALWSKSLEEARREVAHALS